MAQERITRGSNESESAAETEVSAAQTEHSGGDVDDLLDEIDAVLESNSEEFVRNFVQKGGQ